MATPAPVSDSVMNRSDPRSRPDTSECLADLSEGQTCPVRRSPDVGGASRPQLHRNGPVTGHELVKHLLPDRDEDRCVRR